MVNHLIRINNVNSPFNNVKILRTSPERKMMIIIIIMVITTRHLHAHLTKIRANKISTKILLIKVKVLSRPKLTLFSKIPTRNLLLII